MLNGFGYICMGLFLSDLVGFLMDIFVEHDEVLEPLDGVLWGNIIVRDWSLYGE